MLKIMNNINYIDEYDGMRIIDVSNTNLFLKECFSFSYTNNNSFLNINGQDIFNDKVIIISNLTKISELINFSSKNLLLELINSNEQWKEDKIINVPILESISNNINSLLQNDYLKISLEFSKLLKSFFDLNEEALIDKNSLDIWLFNYKNNTKPVVIFDNIEWINVNFLAKYISTFNFLIVTSDATKNIDVLSDLEICSFYDLPTKRLINVESIDAIINWLEMQKLSAVDKKATFFSLKNNFFE